MKRGLTAALLLAAVALSASAAVTFSTLQGEKIPMSRFYEGKWCLGFVVAPGCTSCAVFIGWLKLWQEEQTRSEVNVALVVPWDTPPLRAALADVPFPVVVDPDFVLASWFKVEVAPTVALFAEGTFSEVLTWPFSKGDLYRKLDELVKFVIPRPQDLVGGPPPAFSGEDLEGHEVSAADIPHPTLLFFFSTTCPACHASLSLLDRLTRILPVTMLVLTKGHGLTPDDRKQLEELKETYGDKLRVIVLGEKERQTIEAFRVRWTPTFFLVDAAGIIRAVWEGPSETMVPEIEEALGAESAGGD